MIPIQSLNDLTPDPSIGIFSYLQDFEWNPDADTSFALNYEYYCNRSGSKLPSPLVTRLLVDGEMAPSSYLTLSKLISIRYQYKWNKLWDELSSDLPIFSNVNLSRSTTYGKKSARDYTSELSKSGSEKHTLNSSETRTEEYDSAFPYKTSRTISGGYKDTDTRKSTRTGQEDITESANMLAPPTSTKTTTGGYKDTDTITSTRTGVQRTTDTGDTLTSAYGFNSTNPVPASRVGPADVTGTISETSYGTDGLRDAHTGAIERSYAENGLVEKTEETGTRTTSTSYGADGLIDSLSGNVEREYQNYKDETATTGKKTTTTSYGPNGRTDELSFTDRVDKTETSDETTFSGTDTDTTTGYNSRRLMDKAEFMSLLYTDPRINDFFEVVYTDIDTVMTCPIFVR